MRFGFKVRVRCRACSSKERVPVPIFLPASFIQSSPEYLSSNRHTRSLHASLLQGHILLSRGPRRLRPAPFVLQVAFCLYMPLICFGVQHITRNAFFFFSQLGLDFGFWFELGLGFLPLLHTSFCLLPRLRSSCLSSILYYHLPQPVSFFFFFFSFSFLLYFRPHLGLDFVLALRLDLVLFYSSEFKLCLVFGYTFKVQSEVTAFLLLLFRSFVLCFVVGFSSPQGASSCVVSSCTPTQVSNSDSATAGSIIGITGDVSN